LSIQLKEPGIACEFRIEDQGRFYSAMNVFPERKEFEDLIVGFGAPDIRSGIKHQFDIGILGKQRQGPLEGFPSGPRPMFFQDRFLSVMGNRMEIEIDHLPFVESQAMPLLDKSLLKPEKMDFIQRVGIRG